MGPVPTRWHSPSCDSPRVVVNGDIPQCKACGSDASALLQRAAEERAPSYSGIRLPPEAPIGQMNLWWPPCVPYTRNGAPIPRPVASSQNADTLPSQTSESSLSEIYTSTLGKEHFRLLYLSGSPRLVSPIHGILVKHRLDDCPEYETVSYTWGGEDDDARACRPSYLGDFWDVLFLTRNCWSLLQYLRSQTGTRVVWVDAICINQDNFQERGAQVSLMPQIYGECMRVVIYPGDHPVRRDEHRARERIQLHKDIDQEHLSLCRSVLDSRYISRVWIVQELILPPSAILATENHDIYLENSSLYGAAKGLGYSESSDTSPLDGRGWLEYMGQPRTMCKTTLYTALKMTHVSQATDPRDRIFGILGILGLNPTYSEIVPEYSTSMRDCFIGVMAHTLLVSKEVWPLLNAPSTNTTPQYPSWVPNLESRESWTTSARVTREARRHEQIRDTPVKLAKFVNLEERNSIEFELSVNSLVPSPRHYYFDSHCVLIGSDIPWHHHASIDSNSAALTLRLVRLFDRPHTIEKDRFIRNPFDGSVDGHFRVKGPSTSAYFNMMKEPPGTYKPFHLFLTFHVEMSSLKAWDYHQSDSVKPFDIYLVFADEAEASGTFKLVSCCRLGDQVLLSGGQDWLLPSHLLPPESDGPHDLLSLFENLYKIIHYETRKHLLSRSSTSEATLFDMIIPGRGTDAPSFSQLVLAAARTEFTATDTEEFRRAYSVCLQFLPTEFNPIVDDEYVWFTLADDDALGYFWEILLRDKSRDSESWAGWPVKWWPWEKIFPPWFDLQIPEIGKTGFVGAKCLEVDRRIRFCGRHQELKPGGSSWLHYWLPCASEPTELQMPVRARMPLNKVMEAIRGTRLHWLHRHLLAFSEKVSEDAETLLARGPQPEDSSIYLYEWPKPLVDELGFVWRSEMVTFV